MQKNVSSSGNACIVGTTVTTHLPEDVLELLNQQLSTSSSHVLERDQPVLISYRMLNSTSILYSLRYRRVKNSNSYTVKYGRQKFGQIYYFVHVFDHSYAIIDSLLPISVSSMEHLNISHIALDCTTVSGITAVERGPLECISVTDDVCKCIFMEIDETLYVATFPNSLLYD